MLEDISGKLRALPCIRLLSQADATSFVAISALEGGQVDPTAVFQTVSPAIAFQYTSEQSTDLR